MKPKNRKPTHPGLFLNDVVLPGVSLSQLEIAKRIRTSRNTISLLFNAKLRLSVENAARLGKLLGADDATLIRMQNAYDMWEVHHKDDLSWIDPVVT